MARPRLPLAAELVPGALAVGVFIAWAAAGGGSAPTTLYPGSLFLLGVLAVTIAVGRLRRDVMPLQLPRVSVAAIALLGAFVAWSFLSITWAEVKGDAWDGANGALTYFTVFVLFAIPAWRSSSAATLLGLHSLGVAAVAAAVLLDVSSAQDPSLSFINGRLQEPSGYNNATAALFLAASFPAAYLASRRETPWPLRGLLLAACGLLVEMAILPQSRGAAIVFPIVVLAYLALVPSRVRALLTIVPVAVAAILAAPSLLDVYTVLREGGDVAAAVDDAAGAVWVSAAVLLGLGCLGALLDRRLEAPPRLARAASVGLGALAASAAVVGLVVALNATGDPVDWAQERWDDFKGGYGGQDFSTSRYTGDLGSNRYDFWRVGIEEFADHPVAGVGADNFAVDYLRERRSSEEPHHPHSLPVRLLSQTGIVGAGLFAGFLACALVAALRTRRWAPSEFARGIAAAALAAFGYWLAHASGDWLWVLAALTAPAFAWLALAGSLGDEAGRRISADAGGAPARAERDADPPRRRGLTVALGAAGAALALLAAASLLLPLAAAEDVRQASLTWGDDPEAAYERLDRAADLNFLSDQPALVEGAIAERLGERGRMRAAFESALERNPDSWYALLELGALDAVEGDRAAAIARLREAQALNPGEPLIGEVLAGARRDRPVSLGAIDRSLLSRVCERIGHTDETRFCD